MKMSTTNRFFLAFLSSLLIMISLTGCETIPTSASTSKRAVESVLPTCGALYAVSAYEQSSCYYNGSFLYHPDGLQYEGEVLRGMRHGNGRLTLPNGTHFITTFNSGHASYHGILITKDGQRKQGKFVSNGVFVEESEVSSNHQTQFSSSTTFQRTSNSIDEALRLAREDQARQNNQNVRPQHTSNVNSQPGLYEQYLRQSAQQQQQQHQRVVREQQQQHQQVVRPQQTQQQQTTTVVNNVVTSERRVALVIGNADYPRNRLANAVNDAVDVSAALRNLGFQVMLVQNATLATMRQRTREFADLASTADVALIFYSGHGIEHAGTNYLIPANVTSLRATELESETFNVARWMALFDTQQSSRKNRVNILIIDACRDSGVSLGVSAKSGGFAKMSAPSGTLLAYSTSPGKVAIDGLSSRERNSPYTKNLLRVISQPNMPVEQMFKNVRRMVIEQTRGQQIPWETSSLTGNFVFRRI